MDKENSTYYVAKKSESLYLIARSRGLDVKTLAEANPGIKTSTGDIEGLTVLLPLSHAGRCPDGFLYTIKPGDTFWLLAQRFGTTAEAIQLANPGVNPNNLQIGQVICIPSMKLPAPKCPDGFLYTIKAGDTFFLLAQRFGTTVEAIQRANPGVNPKNLQIGQVICIPKKPVPACPQGFLYTIKPGDTFFLLAQRFGTTVEAIQQANPGVDPRNLQIGQVICIPVKPTPPPPKCPNGFLYTIKPGDTFFLLAQRFGTTVKAIAQANPGVDPNNLQIGQVICIPVKATPPPPKCPGGFLYTIQACDTFFLLAQRFGTTVEALINANPGVDPKNLQIGQVICIPVSPPGEVPPCPSGFRYSIAPGDTFFLLAQRFGTTVAALEQANPGVDPSNLQIGQIICIPVAPPIPCPGGFFYTIQPGDTFFLLAQRFGTTVAALEQANPGIDPQNLPVGGLLCIPVAP